MKAEKKLMLINQDKNSGCCGLEGMRKKSSCGCDSFSTEEGQEVFCLMG
jgi:hypothetical protein